MMNTWQKILRKGCFVFGIVVLATICFCGTVLAQEESFLEEGIPTDGVQVSPNRFNWNLKPGEEQIGFINLKNYSKDKVFHVEVQVEDFYVTDDSTDAKFFVPDENHPLYAYDVINWIETDPTVDLEPGEAKDIFFKVSVPEGTPTGGYYGGIFFKSLVKSFSEDFEDGNGASLTINQRVGTLLILAVEGKEPIKREGNLLSFEGSEKVFFKSPVKFIAKIKNSGNIHYRALGEIAIYKFGQKIETLELLPRILYPDKIRRYEREWDFSGWSYGFYRAEIKLISEDGLIKTQGEFYFWIIPWKTTAILVGLMILIWIIINIFTSKFEIKVKKETQENLKNVDDVGESDGKLLKKEELTHSQSQKRRIDRSISVEKADSQNRMIENKEKKDRHEAELLEKSTTKTPVRRINRRQGDVIDLRKKQ